jgi:hypothetical protein
MNKKTSHPKGQRKQPTDNTSKKPHHMNPFEKGEKNPEEKAAEKKEADLEQENKEATTERD